MTRSVRAHDLRRALALSSVLPLLAACGGGSPSGPGGVPTPAPVATHPVSGVVFYDENANGALDPNELVRLPQVMVTAGSRTATSVERGRFTIEAPAGAQQLAVDPRSLPPYYVPGSPVAVQVPATAEVAIPVTLPIFGNRANVYMAFGDSITFGDFSDNDGFRGPLVDMLRSHWGKADMADESATATKSGQGADRIGESLRRARPAWSIILYGTNDWNDCKDPQACATPENIRIMIRQAKGAGSWPVVGTIIPVNPAFVDRGATERNLWVQAINTRIAAVVQQEGAVLADTHKAMIDRGGSTLPALFGDHVHPNDDGYPAIAHAFFLAITRRR